MANLTEYIKNTPLFILHKINERLIYFFDKEGKETFISKENYPWHKGLESAIEEIQREAEKIFSMRDGLPSMEEISSVQVTSTQHKRWKPFFLFAYGEDIQNNQLKCPVTARLVKKIPGLVMVFFSSLEPGAVLKPHRGIYKGVTRYHLGIKVPKNRGKCGLTVNGEYQAWEEGQSFMFDDSLTHCAENYSDDNRIVLIIDVERKLQPLLEWLNKLCLKMIGKTNDMKEIILNQKDIKGNKSIY